MIQLDPNGIPTRGPAVLMVTSIMIILSTIFVVLRMISRTAIVRKVSLDDYFIILAWVRKNCQSLMASY